jgi:hypothetical protein
LFQKRIYSIFMGTLVGKRKQTIFKKRWFDITSTGPPAYVCSLWCRTVRQPYARVDNIKKSEAKNLATGFECLRARRDDDHAYI